ncbi:MULTISPECIES: fimbrial protein [Serratia]|uniref:fimbrial protein n=1 Tax=Serratia TaxID=613 RepID=UPI0007C885ED|nr:MULTISPECIES: fimbrial protein [Serratia]MDH2267782.1 fimbrial protein [Serratia marcescens]MDH2275759.1 fimbrial protein [Serratia marcescens]OAH32980.1 pilin [Serratia marcescens]PTA78979.1 type 1 fimbrial protein [Serratia sp. Nf2]HEJ7918910.1 type 1 fimbrial protein [Serratia marcescens]
MFRKAHILVAPSLLITFFITQPSVAQSAVIGWGKVNMEGAIVNAACAIEAASRDQTIDMQTLPVEQIAREGHGLTKAFSLRLLNCSVSDVGGIQPGRQHFQMTFDGQTDNGLFGVTGEAKGIALRISDSVGNIIYPGSAMPIDGTAIKENYVNYSMQLVANRQILRAGDYRTAIRFKLNYY